MEARELGEQLGEKEPERKGGRAQEGVKTERKMGAGKKGGKDTYLMSMKAQRSYPFCDQLAKSKAFF